MLSEAVVSIMGGNILSKLRLIDRVVIPGSKAPMKIYTIDLDVAALALEEPLDTKGLVWNMRRRFKARQALESQKQSRLQLITSMEFENPDFKAMRKLYNE